MTEIINEEARKLWPLLLSRLD